MEKYLSSALFWDYENVPLRNKDWKKFMFALEYIKGELKFDFIRIYTRKMTLGTRNRKILLDYGYRAENIKWVKSNCKNAVDNSLMNSCIGVLSTRQNISQILLITGDGDFRQLVESLLNHKITIICRKYNYNQKLIDTVDEAMSVSRFIESPWAIIDI